MGGPDMAPHTPPGGSERPGAAVALLDPTAREVLEQPSAAGNGRLARFVRRQPTFVLGLAVLVLVVIAGVLAPVWWGSRCR
jgi:hypothetical protein